MNHYAGIDVSLKSSAVCIVDGAGKIVREAAVESEPAVLIGWFKQFGIEANADQVGGTVAGVIGAGIAAHAAVSAVKRARMKAGETQAPATPHD